MKLTVFQSDKGDCLMLETADGKHMLIDGGMRKSYTRHVAPTLDRMRRDGKHLDVVYASHVDRDHVFGLLQMTEDLVKWRVYDHFKANPSPGRRNRKPRVKRPPEIMGVWHNAFHEQVGENVGPIRDMLAANVVSLVGVSNIRASTALRELEEGYQNLASSMADAVQLSKRIGKKQLKIPLNKPVGGNLMLRPSDKSPIKLGGATIEILGPSASDLRKLRSDWNTWLENQKTQAHLDRIRNRHRRDENALASTVEGLAAERLLRAESLGNRNNVTQQNLASLMLLVEEQGKTVLLTGDGHGDDVIAGLKHYRRLNADDAIHVDVLKVPHHGSEHNIDEEFCRKVIADDYVFCGDGAHHNPDLRVLEAFAKSRIGTAAERSPHPKVGRSCRFIFSSSETNPGSEDSRNEHMENVRKDMEKVANGKIRMKYLKGDTSKFTIRV